MKLLAAGSERSSQSGAFLGDILIYSSQNYLINWTKCGPENVWTLDHTVTTIVSNKLQVFAGTQSGSIYRLDEDFKLSQFVQVPKAITCLYASENLLFVGSADGLIRAFDMKDCTETLVFSISSRFYPMTLAYNARFDLIAVGGTSGSVFLVPRTRLENIVEMTGHENWVKSVDFKESGSDLFLASGSQDRYIRLWKISYGSMERDILKSNLTTKIYEIETESKLNATFDALLIGHDDWVVSVKWDEAQFRLLSASGDSSLIIWEPSNMEELEDDENVWTPLARLGDVSIMGASTATGATGGFWTAVWLSPSKVATVTRSGSWRVWVNDNDEWTSVPGLTGHTKKVTGISWFGNCLLSCSSDQTTRLWAPVSDAEKYNLNEFCELSRPQIHGYDMNCVCTLDGNQFVSAGDEKTLRSFVIPSVVSDLITNFTGVRTGHSDSQPIAASIAALGLSNKATREDNGELISTDEIPREEQLQRFTLWPEVEKLYGHGYEINCVDVSPTGEYVISCCKANNPKHAVIRIYTTNGWRQLEPLASHVLTVTRARFSPDGKHILSVSRDRQWTVFSVDKMAAILAKPKAHTRIIWDCTWMSTDQFITVSRDKTAKVWDINGECLKTITFKAPVTSCDAGEQIAIGLENGEIHIFDKELGPIKVLNAEGRINQLSWSKKDLAVASDTLRIF